MKIEIYYDPRHDELVEIQIVCGLTKIICATIWHCSEIRGRDLEWIRANMVYLGDL